MDRFGGFKKKASDAAANLKQYTLEAVGKGDITEVTGQTRRALVYYHKSVKHLEALSQVMNQLHAHVSNEAGAQAKFGDVMKTCADIESQALADIYNSVAHSVKEISEAQDTFARVLKDTSNTIASLLSKDCKNVEKMIAKQEKMRLDYDSHRLRVKEARAKNAANVPQLVHKAEISKRVFDETVQEMEQVLETFRTTKNRTVSGQLQLVVLAYNQYFMECHRKHIAHLVSDFTSLNLSDLANAMPLPSEDDDTFSLPAIPPGSGPSSRRESLELERGTLSQGSAEGPSLSAQTTAPPSSLMDALCDISISSAKPAPSNLPAAAAAAAAAANPIDFLMGGMANQAHGQAVGSSLPPPGQPPQPATGGQAMMMGNGAQSVIVGSGAQTMSQTQAQYPGAAQQQTAYGNVNMSQGSVAINGAGVPMGSMNFSAMSGMTAAGHMTMNGGLASVGSTTGTMGVQSYQQPMSQQQQPASVGMPMNPGIAGGMPVGSMSMASSQFQNQSQTQPATPMGVNNLAWTSLPRPQS